MVNLVGRTIGRYQLVELLGQGGMASVYKGYDTRLDRYVAVKVILQSQQDSSRFLKRFEREAKALAKLSHPNIVKVHDYGEEHGMPYLVMEYIPGGTLKDKLGKPMSYQEAARLLLPIAQALDYAHSLGIVHRDVKPANILLTATGVPMLSDFGIAKIFYSGDSTELTGTGVGIGTPEYMAPEQGQGIQVDKRADIYSLGIVFYELITGRKPFHADTPLAVIVKHMSEPLPRPRQFIPNLPETVENVLFTALAKQPSQRYQSMGDFARVLERIVHSAPTWENEVTELRPKMKTQDDLQTRTSVTPPTAAQGQGLQPPVFQMQPPYQVPPQPQPMPVPQAAAGRGGMGTWLIAGGILLVILALLLVGGGVGAYFIFFRATPTRFALTTRTLPAPSDTAAVPGENTPTGGMQEASPTSPVTAPSDTAEPPTEAPLPTATSQPTATAVPSDTALPPTPTLVPVALQIAYAYGDVGNSDIYVADESGRNRRCIACDGNSDEAEPEWSPDGQYVIFQADYAGSYDIWIQNSNGSGSPIQLTTDQSTDEREPHWSTAGEVIYRVSPKGSNRNEIGELWVTQVNGSSYSLGIKGRAPVWSPDGRRIAYMSDQSGIWQIYTYDLDSRKSRQVTNASVNCRWPDWSADGRFIYFNVTTSASSTDPAGIWYVSADGGDLYKLIDGGGAGRPGSSNSGYVAFNTGVGIEIVYADGSGRKVLIDDAKAWAPAWSR